ncbi:NUDIX hydrolase domain protein [Acididesulfobacillus acetoxydans]|uniref:8-oxo-dGTP diphosphatase n=1 Tax=Acididesulfobacillus acetoxydans TaxID=1561005 RepID=A0A8S0W4E8_9FIRM|nr:8-oxo-dGTP diphosphatase MutT [Acididesulfobacillus acetoxydans]CAA7602358.1 NUDIX hydrolase domain protein [Acididesulfobacillus acetoxydans]CEJ08407.1 ADP-ribose pyrophosphatase [Acididesulfobacillus acetoxydans]
MKEVTAAIIVRDGRVLITQRAPGENLAGKWEFPGGKIEAGETPEECLKREIKEELNVDIEVLSFFGQSSYEYDSGTIRLKAFYCRWIAGDFSLRVHSRLEWVTGRELERYDFAAADIPFAQKLSSLEK